MSDQGQKLTQMLDRIEVQFQVMQKLQDCLSTLAGAERNNVVKEMDRYHADNFMADYVMDASGGIKEVRYDWIKKE
ncbi:hypothetical protein KQI22_02105 [Kineothrix sp. MSJ-39]|uniref:hypothetical protein n=1 Tax=Kineothrix sp. MSJ-39 TaxID=2841533 RepID=UPI001C101455|nr:hypothetical protein [Kineothrix sp. MSJ-39]MBU5428861.1 hypothetical protein [Kineothrix sp. MSJ-39]